MPSPSSRHARTVTPTRLSAHLRAEVLARTMRGVARLFPLLLALVMGATLTSCFTELEDQDDTKTCIINGDCYRWEWCNEGTCEESSPEEVCFVPQDGEGQAISGPIVVCVDNELFGPTSNGPYCYIARLRVSTFRVFAEGYEMQDNAMVESHQQAALMAPCGDCGLPDSCP